MIDKMILCMLKKIFLGFDVFVFCEFRFLVVEYLLLYIKYWRFWVEEWFFCYCFGRNDLVNVIRLFCFLNYDCGMVFIKIS